MKSVDISVEHTDAGIIYGGPGYGVEPCPSCGGQLLPGQRRRVVPEEWRPHHETCPAPPQPARPAITSIQTNRCSICGDDDHREGTCLI